MSTQPSCSIVVRGQLVQVMVVPAHGHLDQGVQPRITAGLAVAQNTPKPLQKIIAIGVLPENLPALDAANDNGMQRSRPI